MNKTLFNKLKENNLIDGEMILFGVDEKGQLHTTDIPTFATFFGDSQTYDELIGPHTFTWGNETLTKTGEELGYKPFFDKWKDLGIIE